MSEIKGLIVRVMDNGDVLTDISVDRLRHVLQDDRVKISCNGHTTFRLLSHDHGEAPGTLVATLGNSGFLEVALTGDDASRFLGLRPGMSVTVRW
ncbi:MAG: hypothetical protein O2931_12785 [Planctomycetota bacterium]|nr:hypothetical protein [Planctomycetota bacterium]MDA1179661.1 hypothetical protein [Planctomycetota bacterium]